MQDISRTQKLLTRKFLGSLRHETRDTRHVHVGHDCKILEEAKCCPVHSFEGHSKSTKGGKREVEKGPFGEGEDGGGGDEDRLRKRWLKKKLLCFEK